MRFTVFLLAICIISPVAAQEPELKPLPVDFVAREAQTTAASPFQVAPDGTKIAYNVCRAAAGCSIVVLDVASKEQTPIPGTGLQIGVRWSPDSQHLAFFSDEGGTDRLWIWNRSNGQRTRIDAFAAKARPEPNGGVGDCPIWSPDGTMVYAFAQPPSPNATDIAQVPIDHPERVRHFASADQLPSATSPLTNMFLSPDGRSLAITAPSLTSHRHDGLPDGRIVLVDTTTGTSRTLADPSHVRFNAWVAWSRDSKYLAYYGSPPTSAAQLADVTILDAANGTIVFTSAAKDHPLFVLPGSDIIAPVWAGSGMTLVFGSKHELWKYDVEKQQFQRVASFSAENLSNIITPITSSIAWSPDTGDTVALTARNISNENMELFLVNLKTGKVSRTLSAPFAPASLIGGNIDTAGSGHPIYALWQSSDRPEEIVTLPPTLASSTTIVVLNPLPPGQQLGKTRLLSWTDAYGNTVHGALLLPPNYVAGKRYPTIINQYPGSYQSGSINVYGLGLYPVEDEQLLATRGYAILAPDFPLQRWTITEMSAQMDRAAAAVVKAGVAQPGRIGIEGMSQGGLATIMVAEGSSRFAAAASYAPVRTTVIAMLFTKNEQACFSCLQSGFAFGYLNWGGLFWEKKDVYLANDPSLHLDAIHVPILLEKGALEPDVGQVDVVNDALNQLHRTVEYDRYTGIAHNTGVSGGGSLEFIELLLNREVAWWGKYLP